MGHVHRHRTMRAVARRSVGLRVVVVFFVGCLSAGCVSTGQKHPWLSFARKKAQPTRMVLLISPARADDTSSPALQGMMCRAYFFAGDDPHPVETEGDVVFTAYDQANPDLNRKPDGLFEIPADRLASHLRHDIVGASYVFWLPYDPVAPTQMLVQGRLQVDKKDPVDSSVVSVDLSPAVSAQEMGKMYQYSYSPAHRSRSQGSQRAYAEPIRPRSAARQAGPGTGRVKTATAFVQPISGTGPIVPSSARALGN